VNGHRWHFAQVGKPGIARQGNPPPAVGALGCLAAIMGDRLLASRAAPDWLALSHRRQAILPTRL
jgi:hypothetical protein